MSENKQLPVHIRWMIRRDMTEVVEIEQLNSNFPWGEEDFLRSLAERHTIAMVAEHKEKVIGFMIYELHKKKLHIHNFAVHPDFKRMTIGSQMVAKLIGKLRYDRSRITLEVRETNLASQLFFHKQGFRATKVLRGFYEDSGEDAFFMLYQQIVDVPVENNRIHQYEES